MNKYNSLPIVLVLIFLVVVPIPLRATESVLVADLGSFVKMASVRDLRIIENNFLIDKARQKKTALLSTFIMPKLEMSVATGPAPAYSIAQNSKGEYVENYDFGDIGTYAGFEFKMLQLLNFNRLNDGLYAADCNVNMSKCDVRKNDVLMNQYFQEIYFKYLFSYQMVGLARSVKSNLENAINKIDSLLEADETNVTQNDLLELKTYLFKVNDGLYQANYGTKAAKAAMAFSLNTDSVALKDTVLNRRNEAIMNLDSLVMLMKKSHPDLQKLMYGIEAQKTMVKIVSYEWFPDTYIFGSCKFSNSWKHSKEQTNSKINGSDPYNKAEGIIGLGMRLNISATLTKDKTHREKIELDALNAKEAYAVKGLIVELENQYLKVVAYDERQASAEASMRAADSWLKGMAMRYDLDATQISGLLKAYEKNIQANKDYYQCVLDYNLAVSELISKAGLTLSEYRHYNTPQYDNHPNNGEVR